MDKRDELLSFLFMKHDFTLAPLKFMAPYEF